MKLEAMLRTRIKDCVHNLRRMQYVLPFVGLVLAHPGCESTTEPVLNYARFTEWLEINQTLKQVVIGDIRQNHLYAEKLVKYLGPAGSDSETGRELLVIGADTVEVDVGSAVNNVFKEAPYGVVTRIYNDGDNEPSNNVITLTFATHKSLIENVIDKP